MQCPLTSDYNAFRMNLDAIYAGIIQHGGTDIIDAEHHANRLDKAEGDQVIILIQMARIINPDPRASSMTLKQKV